MKRVLFIQTMVMAAVMLLAPVVMCGQSEQTGAEPPPVEQPLVREGALAVALAEALGLGATTDEVEAESILGTAGISPRNGWIADYPVTPDIVGELQESVAAAADARAIAMTRDDALRALHQVIAETSLSVRPYAPGEGYGGAPPSAGDYPNPTVINNYYYNQGPPVVTYYAPPPDYYYLYSWVPYPFWWSRFWFSGFFILNDFHKVVVVRNRPVFITNHFSHSRTRRVFRIDPVQRFHGRTFAGIGAPRTGGFISPGVRHAPQTVFNPGRHTMPGGGRSLVPSSRSGRTGGPPSGESRMMTPQSGSGRTTGPSSSGGRGSSGGGMRR